MILSILYLICVGYISIIVFTKLKINDLLQILVAAVSIVALVFMFALVSYGFAEAWPKVDHCEYADCASVKAKAYELFRLKNGNEAIDYRIDKKDYCKIKYADISRPKLVKAYYVCKYELLGFITGEPNGCQLIKVDTILIPKNYGKSNK